MASVGHGFGAGVFVRFFVIAMLGMAVFTAAKEQPGWTEEQVSRRASVKNCVASYGTWICWIWGTWVSRGAEPTLDLDPNFGVNVEEVPQCHSVRCYTVSLVELLFDGFGLLVSNPLTLWAKFSEAATFILRTRFSVILKVIGGFFFFVFLNVVAYFIGRIADIIGYLSQLISIIVNMPVIALITRMLSAIWTFLVDAAKSEKRRSKAKKEEKVAKTARVQLAKDVNEIRDLVEQLRTGKNLTEMQALITEMKMLLKNQRPEGQGSEKKEKVGDSRDNRIRCGYCNKPNHTEDSCWSKMMAQGIVPPGWRKRTPSPTAGPSGETSGNGERKQDGKTLKVAALRTLMYTPAKVNGIPFRRCLVDTGSQANVISVRDATKYGISYRPGGIQRLEGFNGSVSPVCGMVDCEVSFGPGNETRKVEFVVTSDVTVPILGLPALQDFQVLVDCAAHELVDAKTGNTVRCSMVEAPKN